MFLVWGLTSELPGQLVRACCMVGGEGIGGDRGRKRACAVSDSRGVEETRGEECRVVVKHGSGRGRLSGST